MAGACGSCTACCRVYSIPEFKKPAGPWCEHCAIGEGCKIYDNRPKRCVDFQCLWLESQSHVGQELAPELRPDRCKVVFSATTSPRIISAVLMPGNPFAWQKGPVRQLIQFLVDKGLRVAIGKPAGSTNLVVTKFGTQEVRMSEPDEDGMQWNLDT